MSDEQFQSPALFVPATGASVDADGGNQDSNAASVTVSAPFDDASKFRKSNSFEVPFTRHSSNTSRNSSNTDPSPADAAHPPTAIHQSASFSGEVGLFPPHAPRRDRTGSITSVSSENSGMGKSGMGKSGRRRRGTARMAETPHAANEGRTFEVLSAIEHHKMFLLFNKYDDDNDGSIHVEQLRSLLVDIGHPMEAGQVMDLINQVDTNGNGLLEFDEFVQMLRIFKDTAQFRLYEGDGDKVVSRQSSAAYSFWLPDAHWRWAWDIFIFLVGLYTWLATFALHLVSNEAEYWDWSALLMPSDIIVTFVIVAHFVVSLKTPYFINRDMVEDHTMIVVNYFTRDWGIPVVLSVLPMRLFSTSYVASLVLAHFRLLFTLQCASLFRNSNRILLTRTYINFHFSFVPFFRQFIYFIILVHTAAVLLFNLFDEKQSYSACVYVIMYIFAAVGYGDVELAGNSSLQIYGCFLCLLAMLINGLVIGSVVSFIQGADVENTRRGRLVETQAVLKFFDVPISLQEEILQFQNHIMNKDVTFAYHHLVSHLPREIKGSLTLQFQMQLLNSVSVFKTAHNTARIAICQVLRPFVFTPENYITVAGEVGYEMFFINYGFVDVLSASGIYEATLSAFKCFGELAVLSPHTGDDFHFDKSCKTLTYVEVLVLTREKFDEIMDMFPRFKHEVEEFQQTIGVQLYVPSGEELHAVVFNDEQASPPVLISVTGEGGLQKKSGPKSAISFPKLTEGVPSDDFLSLLVDNGVEAVLEYLVQELGIEHSDETRTRGSPVTTVVEQRVAAAAALAGVRSDGNRQFCLADVPTLTVDEDADAAAPSQPNLPARALPQSHSNSSAPAEQQQQQQQRQDHDEHDVEEIAME